MKNKEPESSPKQEIEQTPEIDPTESIQKAIQNNTDRSVPATISEYDYAGGSSIYIRDDLVRDAMAIYVSPLYSRINELQATVKGLQNECTHLSDQSNTIDKIVFNEDLSVFEKIQNIQKLLL